MAIGLKPLVQVPRQVCRVRARMTEDGVHDLRVAVRRTRSLAQSMMDIADKSLWRKLDRQGKKLFRELSGLRDLEVMQGWVLRLRQANDPLADLMLQQIAHRHQKRTRKARQAVRDFHLKKWQSMVKQLRKHSSIAGLTPAARKQICRGYFEAAQKRYRHHGRRPDRLHELRISLKQFRYSLEGFLPERCRAWEHRLKNLQDDLGDYHDLEILASWIVQYRRGKQTSQVKVWQRRIARQQAKRLQAFARASRGPQSIWREGKRFFSDSRGS